MTSRRAGSSLIELLVVIAILAMIGVILTAMLKTTLEAERLQAGSFDRLVQTSRLADDFRADVARAEKTLPSWEDVRANDQTLILSLKGDIRIIYQWRAGKLWRSVYEPEDFHERVVPIDSNMRFEFVQPTGTDRLVRLRLHRKGDTQKSPGGALELAAALGGDTR